LIGTYEPELLAYHTLSMGPIYRITEDEFCLA